MGQFGLLLRGLWWRRGLSLATVLVGAITIGAGCLGPLYAHAADESTLRDRLVASSADAALRFTSTADYAGDVAVNDVRQSVPAPGSIKAYPNLIQAVGLPTEVQRPTDGAGELTRLIWRDGACAHFVITTGRCATRPDEVVVSERTVQNYGWRPGTVLVLADVLRDTIGADGQPVSTPVTVTVVGGYRLRDSGDAFWVGRSYFNARIGSGDNPDTVDGLFTPRPTLAVVHDPKPAEFDLDFPIDPHRVRLASVPGLRTAVTQLRLFHNDPTAGSQFESGIEGVLAAARAEQRLVDLATLLVSLQLAVLAWLVLFEVVTDAVEAKGSEIALAKLRGLRPGATVRFGLAEPVLLLALATPLGLLGGWLAVRIFAATVLAPDTPVALTPGTGVAVLAALAGSLVAAVAAGRRTLRRSVLQQWRRAVTSSHSGRLVLALDVVLAVAAAAGLVLLRRNTVDGRPHPASLLAPSLAVFAVALLGVRLLPVLLRPLLPATRGGPRIGLFLAVRQVVRRPTGLRLAALLAVAVGLATFAIAGEGVASHNRQARARAELGAEQVVGIQYESAHDPLAAVRAADPQGRWAMATAGWLPSGGGWVTGRVLAVDAPRFAAVAFTPPTALTGRALAAALDPPFTRPVIAVRTSRVRVTVDTRQLTPGPAPYVRVDLRTAREPFLSSRAGRLQPGRHQYVAPVACTAGCTLSGLTWERPIDTFGDLAGTVVVNSIEIQTAGGWQRLPDDLTVARAWRHAVSGGASSDRVTVTPAGVEDSWTSSTGASAGLQHADSPQPLPVLATPQALVPADQAQGTPRMADDTATEATFAVVGRPGLLPAVLDNGLLVDLRSLTTQLPDFANEASWSVWLGPDAPPDALARLRAAGLVLDAPRTWSGRVAQLRRQGPALALQLLVVCAIAGSVLAVGGTAIAIAATGRRRSFELAALRAVGIRRRVLLRASVIEQLLLLGAAVLLGAPTGYLAARISMPSIPEFADRTPVPLQYTPALRGTAEFLAVFLVLLAGTAVIAGFSLMRAAAPSRLREAE